MYGSKYMRVRLGGKVDIKSRFEKFEKLSKTDQNDNSLNLGSKERVPSFRRREIGDAKKDISGSPKIGATDLKKRDISQIDKSTSAFRKEEAKEPGVKDTIDTKRDLPVTKRTEEKQTAKKDEESEKSYSSKTEKKEENMERASKKFEGLKLRETDSSSKGSPSTTRGKSGTSTFAARKAEEKRKNEEATKKMKSIEQRMQERKQQKMADHKKKVQGRAAFKQQLEANAPKGTGKKDAIAKAETNIDKLLKWVQQRINVYPGVRVDDWTTSWSDGKAFCALVQSLEPDDFPVNDVDHSGEDRYHNFKLAFDFASEVGVPPLLDPHDMASLPVPDRRSVITYVHTIYKVMVHEKKEKEKKENDTKNESEEDSSD